MDPGELDTQVTIQQTTGSRDAYGGQPTSWAAITGGTNVWAKIEPLSGRESLIAQSNQATTTHRVTIRALDGITPRMRVVVGSRYLNIAALRPLGFDRQYVQLDCMEVV